MTIYTNSRYAGQTVLRVLNSDGVTYPTIYYSAPSPPIRYLHYKVVLGDRLDNLANKFFNDPTLWWFIAQANPEIFYPDQLLPGSIIRIPQA